MKRLVLAVVAGYVVLAITIMLAFAPAAFSPGLAFAPGTRDATLPWMLYTQVMGFLAAIAGGWTAARLAREQRRAAVIVLASLVFVFGVLSALRRPSAPAALTGGGEDAREPLGYALLLPALGVAGVLAGGVLHRRGPGRISSTDAHLPLDPRHRNNCTD